MLAALLLRLALVNPRSAERGALRVWRQAAGIAAIIAFSVVLLEALVLGS